MDRQNGEDIKGDVKAKRTRSPNYPGLDLEQALAKAKVLFEKEGRNSANVEVVLDHWRYAPKSGPGTVALAALKKYGLIATGGAGAQRKARLTDEAWTIFNDPDSPESTKHRKGLALNPPIFREVWDYYEGSLPSDASLRKDLVLERGFSESGADEFIDKFRKTIAYAGLGAGDQRDRTDKDTHGDGAENGQQKFKVGDLVQWESMGSVQFERPRRIEGIEDDWAFVEGSNTGLPLADLRLVSPLEVDTSEYPKKPPRFRTEDSSSTQMLQDVFSSADGVITVEWPAQISPDFFQDIKEWIKILERKIGRAVIQPEGSNTE